MVTQDIIDKVKESISHETGFEEINQDTRLDSLVEDSLEFMCLITALRNDVGDIPDIAVAKMDTIGDVIMFYDHVRN